MLPGSSSKPYQEMSASNKLLIPLSHRRTQSASASDAPDTDAIEAKRDAHDPASAPTTVFRHNIHIQNPRMSFQPGASAIDVAATRYEEHSYSCTPPPTCLPLYEDPNQSSYYSYAFPTEFNPLLFPRFQLSTSQPRAKTLNEQARLRRHDHDRDRYLTCACGLEFSKHWHLRRHRFMCPWFQRNIPRRVICECGRRFRTETDKIQHMNMSEKHGGEKVVTEQSQGVEIFQSAKGDTKDSNGGCEVARRADQRTVGMGKSTILRPEADEFVPSRAMLL